MRGGHAGAAWERANVTARGRGGEGLEHTIAQQNKTHTRANRNRTGGVRAVNQIVPLVLNAHQSRSKYSHVKRTTRPSQRLMKSSMCETHTAACAAKDRFICEGWCTDLFYLWGWVVAFCPRHV